MTNFSMCSLDLCLASLFLPSRQGMFFWHRKLWMWWKFSIITMSVFTLRFAEDRLLTGKEGGNRVWREAPAGCQEGRASGMARLNRLTSERAIATQILIPVHDSLSDPLPCKHSWSLAGPCPWIYQWVTPGSPTGGSCPSAPPHDLWSELWLLQPLRSSPGRKMGHFHRQEAEGSSWDNAGIYWKLPTLLSQPLSPCQHPLVLWGKLFLAPKTL